ncbi:hypothetical protein KR044_007333 [Drosophila immigrans]|nr:hypothetical protein KR044_007333 [Drosophila immigrans]
MLLSKCLLWFMVISLVCVAGAQEEEDDDFEKELDDLQSDMRVYNCSHTKWKDVEIKLKKYFENILETECNWLLAEGADQILLNSLERLEMLFNKTAIPTTETPLAAPTTRTTTTEQTVTTTTTTTTSTTTPAPTTTTTTTTVPPIVSCGRDNEKRCVEFWNCKSSRMLEDKYEIDLKKRDACNYLETCCSTENILNAPKPSSGSPTSQSCGYGTDNGVHMTITGNDRSESNFGEFPWTVAVLNMDNAYLFGGSLISLKVVLTSASLVSLNVALKVRAGDWDMRTDKESLPHEERLVVDKIKHSSFALGPYANDVALLLLEREFSKSAHIGHICLPRNIQLDYSNCVVTGWNKSPRAGRSIMTAMKLQLANCGASTHNTLLCVRGDNTHLKFSTGSPLACPKNDSTNRYYQIGVWSHGIGTNRTEFTNVTKQYDWIIRELGSRNISIR